VLTEKPTGFQLLKKFPAFYGTWRFITVLTSARHLSLSWATSIQSIPPHPTSWRSILILYPIYAWVSQVVHTYIILWWIQCVHNVRQRIYLLLGRGSDDCKGQKESMKKGARAHAHARTHTHTYTHTLNASDKYLLRMPNSNIRGLEPKLVDGSAC